MDKGYWEKYYKSEEVHPPSLFAQSLLNKDILSGDKLIEFGCGNGRDCMFFSHHGIQVLAVDQSKAAISSIAKSNSHPNLRLMNADFTSLDDLGKFNHVYSRFTMHSIKETEEDRVIKWSYDHLHSGGKLLIEARSIRNELYKKGEPVPNEPHAYIYNDHYRRFIDTDKLHKKLEAEGFKVIYFEEQNGFGGETDQLFFRTIAKK